MIRMTGPTIRGTVIAILATVLLTITGCSRPEHPARSDGRLDLADDLMESRPDSALTVLSSIDTTSLADDGEKARYALLMSMALDKNYIDTTNFDILQPAIDYYPTHGTPDEKLRTFYYQGRIYQNASNFDMAMQSFLKADDLKDGITDTLTYANLLVAQGSINYISYQINTFITNNLIALRLYRKIGNNDYALSSLLRALGGCILNKDKHRGRQPVVGVRDVDFE